MTWAPGPVVTRRRLGGELRRLRDGAGLKLDDVALKLECSPSKISRLENGKGIPKWRDVRDMLDVYGLAQGEERTQLLEWAETGRERMWWRDYADVLDPGFDTYVELEWDASSIYAFESRVVHGLLQTPDYARAILRTAWVGQRTASEIDRLVDVRLRRQEALKPAHGLMLHCILDESALYRVVGSREIVRRQIDHLVDLAAEEHIDVRILPFSAGLVLQGLTPFAKLEFATGIEQGMVYFEAPASTFVSEAGEVATYDERMSALLAVALKENDSVPLMQYAARRL